MQCMQWMQCAACSVQCSVALRLRIPNGCPLWSCSAPCTRQHQPAETLQYLRTNPIFSSTFSPRMTIFSPIGFILNQVNSNLFSPFLMRYFPSAISFHPFSGPVLLGRGLVLTSTRSLSFVFQPLSLIPISPVPL